MPVADVRLENARAALLSAQDAINDEIRHYPTPISGCDAQFNWLLDLRQRIGQARVMLDTPSFVATPRQLVPMARPESR